MSEENKDVQNEELNKSMDSLIDEIFFEEVEKSIDIAGDASTKADDVKVEENMNDEKRGAGRPKQISDVPKTDMDGRRESEYDASITEPAKEEDREEIDQVSAVDQTTEGEGRIKQSPSAPKTRPFVKSEDEDLYAEFLAFKKSKEEEAESLKKAEQQEELTKSVDALVKAQTEELRKSMDELRKENEEQKALIKSIAKTPMPSKSITGIEQVEKSINEEVKGPEAFSKSEMLDAAEELAKSKKISTDAVVELEMTGTIADASSRKAVEAYLQSK